MTGMSIGLGLLSSLQGLDEAQDLVWYLRAAPDAADRDAVQRKIDDLGAHR